MLIKYLTAVVHHFKGKNEIVQNSILTFVAKITTGTLEPTLESLNDIIKEFSDFTLKYTNVIHLKMALTIQRSLIGQIYFTLFPNTINDTNLWALSSFTKKTVSSFISNIFWINNLSIIFLESF